MKKIKLTALTFIIIGFAFISAPANAQEKCNFTFDLELGSVGPEVVCLQKFLNSAGYIIASTGAGSPGKETDTFREKTQDALIRWQNYKGISPATGVFGPKSRAAYQSIFASAAPSPATTVLTPQLAASMGIIMTPIASTTPAPAPTPSPSPVSIASSQDKKLIDQLKKLRNAIEQAEEDIDDAEDDGDDVGEAKNDLEKAKKRFLDAVYAFFDGEHDEADDLINATEKKLEDATENINGNEDRALKAINDAKKAISDAKKEIKAADDDGDDVENANDLLDEAEEKLDDAREEFDDRDYEKAKELAEEAENIADDAVDAL